MSENDLTPRVLAGLALAADPARFMSFRLMPDGSCVIVDQDGRKFILTQSELRRVEDETIARRLHARGRALVEDLKNGAPKKTIKSAAKKVPGPATKKASTSKKSAASKTKKAPGPTPKPKTKPA